MSALDVTPRQLQTFLVVLEEGNFTAAAGRLGMSQPTVSRQVAALERALGVRLFDRHTRRVRPTKAASALVPEAERQLAGARSLQAAALARPASVPRLPLQRVPAQRLGAPPGYSAGGR